MDHHLIDPPGEEVAEAKDGDDESFELIEGPSVPCLCRVPNERYKGEKVKDPQGTSYFCLRHRFSRDLTLAGRAYGFLGNLPIAKDHRSPLKTQAKTYAEAIQISVPFDVARVVIHIVSMSDIKGLLNHYGSPMTAGEVFQNAGVERQAYCEILISDHNADGHS